MKSKFFLISIFCFLIFNAFCQEDADKFLIGGNMGFSYSKSKADNLINSFNNQSTTLLSCSPILGYNVYKKLFIGISISAYFINTNYDDFEDAYYHQYNYSFEPFLRYYFIKGFFGQLKFNVGKTYSEQKLYLFNQTTNENELNLSKSKYTALGINIATGYDIPIAKNVYLEPMISYMSNVLLDKSSDNKEFQNNISINIGIITKF